MPHFRFILREIAGSRAQSFVLVLCVALSILTLTSLGSFSSSVRRSMLKDARQLLAADITINSHYPLSEPLMRAIQQAEEKGKVQGARVNEFYSMAANPAKNKSVLSYLKVVEPGYPFYGRVELTSGREFRDVLKEGSIIVEQVLLDRLEAGIGSRLRIGSTTLTIGDVVTLEPDRPVSLFSFGPRIFISAADLDRLDLVKKGSRVHFNYLFKVHDPGQVDQLAGLLAGVAAEGLENVQTFRTANSRVKKNFDNFLFFLNLIGIFTLLLAGIGIQTSLYALLRKSYYTIAIMKSVGASSRFIMTHFIGLIILLGTAGTFIGLGLSSLLQLYFPTLFAGILPASVTLSIAWKVVLEGLVLGTIVVVLFSFLPLRRIKALKPAFIFRKEVDAAPRGIMHYGAIGLIVFFFVGLVIWQLEDVRTGLYFLLGLSGLIGLTTVITWGMLVLLRNRSPRSLPLRQAFKGLFRPGNATHSIIITLSASLSVIFSIYLVDHNLRMTFIKSYPPNLPNAYFLDIQPDQKKEFSDILGMDAQYFPVIRARLISINNRKIDRARELERKRDNLAREFNLTYRNFLLEDEQMLEGGTLYGKHQKQLSERGELPVSVLDTVAEIGEIRVGDLLTFKIQGIPLKARVTSMRTRTKSKIRPFFYFVFPEETLREAPQTIFSSIRIERDRLTTIQNTLTMQLPNVSVIDISSTIEILSRIMGKMFSIIRFFTSFSIIAGLLIIISSIFATRLTRIREAVYFKISGATSAFVLYMFAWENLTIGLISALSACLISQAGSWLICRQIFDIAYRPLPGGTIVMIVTTLLTVLTVGLGASLSILRQKPIAFLRDEEQE